MENLHLLEYWAEASHCQCLIIENSAHGTEKLLLKTQVSEDFAQWSESNNIIY